MKPPRMRPLLRARVALPRAELRARIEGALDRADSPCRGRTSTRNATLLIHERHRHFWSPSIDMELDDEGPTTRLWGRFGPEPDIWGLFLGLYAVSVFSTIAGLMLGFCQWFIGGPPWGLLVCLGSVGFGLAVYATAFIGQRLGHDQMIILETFLRDAAQVPIVVFPEPD